MTRAVYWIGFIAIGLCLMFLFLSDPPLQEKVAETYYVTNRGRYYWNKLKQPSAFLRSYFFPRSIVGGKSIEVHPNEVKKGRGRGKRMAEAAEKSLEETESEVEDSAKSAAEITRDAVHKTLDTVKTLFKGKSTDSHDEL